MRAEPVAAEPRRAEESGPGDESGRLRPVRAIFVASIGNALEWYDLVVFGFLSATIAKQFFPSGDPTTSLLLTFATFGVSFLIRPLGGILLGVYADKAGRVRAMTLAAGLMMLGTTLIAFLPNRRAIGISATLGLVLARLIQGFSAGGEFASATAFLAEQSQSRRGFFTSWQVASLGVTTILASCSGYALYSFLPLASLDAWGWRLPFLFGMSIGPIALYMRLKVPEPAAFAGAEHSRAPLRETLRHQKERLLISIGLSVLPTVSSYVVLFTPTFATRELGLKPADAFAATLATGLVQLCLAPAMGYLGDRVGRVPVMLSAGVAMLLSIVPLYVWLVHSPTPSTLLLVQLLFGCLQTIYYASQPALLSELFPVRTRSTGISLGYNFAVTVFGGFAPFIIIWLIAATGSKLAPGFYVMFAAALSIAAVLAARTRLALR